MNAARPRGRGAPHNPFSSAHVQPGAVPWLADGSTAIPALFDTLQRTGRRAQIVGPHGTGKTTLMTHLASHARDRGWRVFSWQPGGRLPATPSHQTLVTVDSAELARPAERAAMLKLTSAPTAALLVCTHDDWPLPTLHRTQPSVDLFRQIATRLLAASDMPAPAASELQAIFLQHRGNLRLALFELYNWYESWAASQRRRTPATPLNVSHSTGSNASPDAFRRL